MADKLITKAYEQERSAEMPPEFNDIRTLHN